MNEGKLEQVFSLQWLLAGPQTAFKREILLTINRRIWIGVPITLKVVGEFFLIIQDLVFAGITEVDVCENTVLGVEEAVWRALLK